MSVDLSRSWLWRRLRHSLACNQGRSIYGRRPIESPPTRLEPSAGFASRISKPTCRITGLARPGRLQAGGRRDASASWDSGKIPVITVQTYTVRRTRRRNEWDP